MFPWFACLPCTLPAEHVEPYHLRLCQVVRAERCHQSLPQQSRLYGCHVHQYPYSNSNHHNRSSQPRHTCYIWYWQAICCFDWEIMSYTRTFSVTMTNSRRSLAGCRRLDMSGHTSIWQMQVQQPNALIVDCRSLSHADPVYWFDT